MKPSCKTPNCPRSVHSVGLCRPCREKTLHGEGAPVAHRVGEARDRLVELVAHYGSAGTTAKAVGLGRGTITRVLTVSAHEPLKVTAFDRIMNHEPLGPGEAPVSGLEVAAYALTAAGRAFVEECWSPKARKAMAA